LYNLANLYEDRGDRDKTVSLFRRILALDPNNPKALARLAPLVADEADLVERLDAVSLSKEISISDRIDALHALGKIRDAQADYDRAFVYFEAANVLNATQMPPYDQEAVERYFDQIIESVSATWLETHRLNETAQPIFVCGMFRSGSTLADQILGSHPDITTGGERDSLVREFNSSRLRYPADLVDVEQATLSGIAGRYLARSKALFPEARLLTDKRPDNFLYLGAMKALFPKAKIIYTMRNPLDNCLSVYFERLGLAMNYAVSLDSTAHYYEQQVRLRNHWQSLFGADVHVVDYEQLIKEPKSQVSEMLRFLGLEWHDDCLNFHALGNTVKTASVWQIRKPLYTTSVGRWRNYESHLGALAERYADGTGGA
ncbi:MAG: sulfotransferase, partial [Woeseia sp.]